MWQPTGGRLSLVEKRLNDGMLNQMPIFLHYSNEEGIRKIVSEMQITDVRRNETRPGSKVGIYLCPSHHTFNQENVWTLLFLGNDRYKDRGGHVVIFAWNPPSAPIDQPVTSGSWARELIYQGGSVTFTHNDLIYSGPNPFLDVFTTENPNL